MSHVSTAPTLAYETLLWAEGYRCVAGLDEAGRGAWAGPVVAGAVILPAGDPDLLSHLNGVNDSKRLSPLRREAFVDLIQEHALTWGVGSVSPSDIDTQGIVPSTRQAMALALDSLQPSADSLLVDYLALPEIKLPQRSLPKGDARVLSIAAASILAKVSRDRLMVELDDQFPGYGFARHKGYGTAQHRAALQALGPTPIHRFSFAPLRELHVDASTDRKGRPFGENHDLGKCRLGN
jgi:ribonuclease HII